jgi:hypothetical protein
MLEHPAVMTNKKFKKELQAATNLKDIATIFVRYMAKVKKKRNKK